jgi:hypothetical protein
MLSCGKHGEYKGGFVLWMKLGFETGFPDLLYTSFLPRLWLNGVERRSKEKLRIDII